MNWLIYIVISQLNQKLMILICIPHLFSLLLYKIVDSWDICLQDKNIIYYLSIQLDLIKYDIFSKINK